MSAIDQFIIIRKLVHTAVAELSPAAWLEIPEGFDNNIAWNVGHVIAVQQRLHNIRVEVAPYVSEDFIESYKPGTSPADGPDVPDIDQLLTLLLELPPKLAADYDRFKTLPFQGSTSVTGFVLNTLDDAIVFNNYHEGLHLGFIQALKNLV